LSRDSSLHFGLQGQYRSSALPRACDLNGKPHAQGANNARTINMAVVELTGRAIIK
jgi:hypothetical protein